MLPQTSTTELSRIIILGAAAMLSLAVSIVLFIFYYQRRVIRHQQEINTINSQKQLELIQASIQGEEEERTRIAAELHDDVGATLSSVRLYLHAAAQQQKNASIIDQSRELLDDSIRKIRAISHKLQPALLQQLGLQTSLDSFAAMVSNTGALCMTCSSQATLPRLDDAVELSIYRIVQELTSNLLRHAQPANIHLELYFRYNKLYTTLVHDGAGLTEEMYQDNIHKKGAIGLKNIVNRLKTINATISFRQMEDGRYNISIITAIRHSQET